MDQVSAANADAPMHDAPHCGAKDRAGMPCQSVPMKGRKRCRVHGGLSPGAPRGHKNGNYKDGYWTREAVEERRFIRSLLNSGPER
jgi:glucans biosynthesis protein